MTDYNGGSEVMSLAHSCRNYRHGSAGTRMSAASEGISCSSCANWGSSKCMKDAFETLSSDLDYI